jgi:hypothetical protein
VCRPVINRALPTYNNYPVTPSGSGCRRGDEPGRIGDRDNPGAPRLFKHAIARARRFRLPSGDGKGQGLVEAMNKVRDTARSRFNELPILPDRCGHQDI